MEEKTKRKRVKIERFQFAGSSNVLLHNTTKKSDFSNNNFKIERNKQNANFNLWCVLNEAGRQAYKRNIMIYYSYCGRSVEIVTNNFEKIFEKKKSFIAIARMHNNKTRELIKIFKP